MAVDDGRVVSNFIVAALRGEPLVVYGDGQQTRSFCYVDDMVRGLELLMNHDLRDYYPGPFDLGNPEGWVTISDLALAIIRHCDSESAVEHQQTRKDDPVNRRPDISRAKRILNWTPSTAPDEGLKKTIAYFRARLHSELYPECSIMRP